MCGLTCGKRWQLNSDPECSLFTPVGKQRDVSGEAWNLCSMVTAGTPEVSSVSTWPPLHRPSLSYFLSTLTIWVMSYVGPLERTFVTLLLLFPYFGHIFWNGRSWISTATINNGFFFFYRGEWDALWSNRNFQNAALPHHNSFIQVLAPCWIRFKACAVLYCWLEDGNSSPPAPASPCWWAEPCGLHLKPIKTCREGKALHPWSRCARVASEDNCHLA